MTPAAHEPADTGGTPWGGRTLTGTSTGFDADVGAADPQVLEALVARASDPSVEHDVQLMRRVTSARWIVPLVATPTQVEPLERVDGRVIETSTELAAVTLTAPDGRRALPVFTGTAALAAWDAAARPVPVTAARAAQAAVAEGCDVLVVDVGSAASTELRPSMVQALAHGREWAPAHLDPLVAQCISSAVAVEQAVVEHRLAEGTPSGAGVLRLVLGLPPGLRQADVQDLTARVAERLAADGEFRVRVDGLAFALVTSARP